MTQSPRPRYHGERWRSFRVADVQHAPSIALHVDRRMHRVAKNVRPRFAAAVVQVRDPSNIVLRFPVSRNASAARPRSRTSVIASHPKPDPPPPPLQQSPSSPPPPLPVF